MATKRKQRAKERQPRPTIEPQAITLPAFDRTQRMTLAAMALALFLASLLLYWPTTGFEFVNFDDDVYITNNEQVKGGLTAGSVAWAFRSTDASNWHPLTWLSHMLDVTIWGVSADSAHGHHLTNVLLHAFNAALALLVWSVMTRQFWPSALVAALFAFHPLRVESVAWVAERKDLLAGLFWFATIGAYLWYTRVPTSKLRYLCVLVSFALGLMSKPMLVTLPCVLLLLDYWPLRRVPGELTAREAGRTLWPLVREKLPLLGLVLASSAMTYFAQQAGGAVAGKELPLATRLTNSVVSYQTYITQHLWPVNLAVFYPLDANQLTLPLVAISTAMLLLVSIVAVIYRNRRPYLPVGWMWYLGTLVPVIGIVQVGGQAHADRYTYIPSIGLYVIAAWGLVDVAARWPKTKPWLAAMALVGLLALAGLTRHQMQYWRTSVTLFQRAAVVSPQSVVAWNNLGAAQLQRGEVEEAVVSYRRAWEMQPLPPLANNLAWLLATHVDPNFRSEAEAVHFGELADRLTGGKDPTVLDTLAAAYAAAGRFDDALRTADLAIEQAQARNDEELLHSITERRELYQAGQPYRDPTTRPGAVSLAPVK